MEVSAAGMKRHFRLGAGLSQLRFNHVSSAQRALGRDRNRLADAGADGGGIGLGNVRGFNP